MSAFSVISLSATNIPLDEAIMKVYPNAYLKLSPYAWLINDNNVTTQEVCTKLNILPEGIGNAIVIKCDSYFGMAPRNIWEWLAVKAREL